MRETTDIIRAIASVWAMPGWAKWLGTTSGAVLGYFLPTDELRGIAVAIFGLIVIDSITGIWAAKKSGEKIESAKLGRIITKILTYSVTLAAAVFSTRALPMLGPKMVEIAAMAIMGLIAVREVKSVWENHEKATGIATPQMIQDAMHTDQTRNDLPSEGQ